MFDQLRPGDSVTVWRLDRLGRSLTAWTPIPIPNELALELAAGVKRWQGETIVTDEHGRRLRPWALREAMRTARAKVDGLPKEFRFHDLRHYFASLLIASGADVKVCRNECDTPAP